jgi:flagellar basal-body rod protein FlgG
MVRGLYASAIGMTTQMKKMDVTANNIANVNTTGFKRDLVITRSFHDELVHRLDDVTDFVHARRLGSLGPGNYVDTIHTDFRQGGFIPTGSLLDFAINGEGFFAINVRMANGEIEEMYTRDGSFVLTPDNMLVTSEGNFVMGQNGSIILPLGHVEIGDTGRIYVDNQLIDIMRIVNFENPQSLRAVGDNLFTTTPESQFTSFNGIIKQAHVESSNVNSVKEMVELITISRTYEANSRAIQVYDTILQRAVNDIARK